MLDDVRNGWYKFKGRALVQPSLLESCSLRYHTLIKGYLLTSYLNQMLKVFVIHGHWDAAVAIVILVFDSDVLLMPVNSCYYF